MAEKPNILFVLSDQQRWDTLGCYGQELDITPNIDQMAESGVKFEQANTCQPVCNPARSCLQTGKFATETGCYRNDVALPQDEKTIAHWFMEAGYDLGYIGKWHLASTGGPSSEKIGPERDYHEKPIPVELRGGWKDHWIAADLLEFTSGPFGGHLYDEDMDKVSFDGYRVDEMTDMALNYLNNRQKGNPFLLFLSFLEPHHQNDQKRYVGPKGSQERFSDFEPPGDLKGNRGDWKENYPDYLGCCASIDKNVGRMKEALKKNGMLENTLIVYTSDHGSHFRTRNKELSRGQNVKGNDDDYKRSCHEASTHIPLVIEGPGFRGGKKINELVSLIDLPPTLLKTANIQVPDYMQGRSLQQLTNAKNKGQWREATFIQISESKVGRAIKTKNWKFSVKAHDKLGIRDAKSKIYYEDHLYNLRKDPHEQNNLIDEPGYMGIKEHLKAKLKSKMELAGEEEPKIVSTISSNS